MANFLFVSDHATSDFLVRLTHVHMCTKFEAARIKCMGVRAIGNFIASKLNLSPPSSHALWPTDVLLKTFDQHRLYMTCA